MLALLIVGCEIGFWICVLLGLIFRYILNMPKVGAFFLICTPLVDVVLLIATGIDLRDGTTATMIHSLSAIYLGVSIAYGHRMIKWADQQFVYRFKGGPKPSRKPKYGTARASYERNMWYRHVLAWSIGSLIMLGLTLWIGDENRTATLVGTMKTWSFVLLIDFCISMSYTIWPKNKNTTSEM